MTDHLENERTFEDYDGADEFARVLASTDEGMLLTAQVEVLPGLGEGPAGMATYRGVVVEVLKDSGDYEDGRRYFRSLRMRNGDRDEDYRLDYRGVSPGAECWFRRGTGEQEFDGSEAWGRRRRVYAVSVEGNGITATRKRPGHSFLSVQTEGDHAA